jgi:hypothetical protein
MESKKYNVLVYPIADSKLAAHIEFLARVSENAADKLYVDYKKAIEYLEDSPESCPVYTPKTRIDALLRFKLFGSRYRIVFEIIGNDVFAYDIQDCRQDADKNLV